MTTEQYLSDKHLATRYAVCRATPWRWAKQGLLPQPVRLAPGCTRWKASDIEKWENKREVAK